MMIAMLAVTVGMQAQTKFHDAEANDVKGAVKKMTINVMGRDQVFTFSEDGKAQIEGLTDVVYDADGYIQSAKMNIQGQQVGVTYTWENGRIKSQSMDMMGQKMTITHNYNDKGEVTSDAINMGGQEMSSPYSDYKYDDHGNWISRKGQMMGQEMEQKRSIEYYK